MKRKISKLEKKTILVNNEIPGGSLSDTLAMPKFPETTDRREKKTKKDGGN